MEKEKSIEETTTLGYSGRGAVKVAGLISRNKGKRRQTASSVRITHGAFGKNRRMPITSQSMKGELSET